MHFVSAEMRTAGTAEIGKTGRINERQRLLHPHYHHWGAPEWGS